MKKNPAFFVISLVVVSMLCLTSVAKATIINGDFSTGTLAGWETSGNVNVTDYCNMPAAYKNTWDLSAWKSKMVGSFALIDETSVGMGTGGIGTTFALIPGSTLKSLSFDYAVAWSRSNLTDPNGYGYFIIGVSGITDNGIRRPLAWTPEVSWASMSSGLNQGVFTGTFFRQNSLETPFLQFPDLTFSEIQFGIAFLHPNYSVSQIIGIDNVNISMAPPVPEPPTMILVGFGLVGFAVLGRKIKRS